MPLVSHGEEQVGSKLAHLLISSLEAIPGWILSSPLWKAGTCLGAPATTGSAAAGAPAPLPTARSRHLLSLVVILCVSDCSLCGPWSSWAVLLGDDVDGNV